jgi:hypothetical protein
VTRIKFDVKGVDSKRTVLPAGVYNVKVVSADVTHPEMKEERIELVAEVIGDKAHNGQKLYEYISVEPDSAQKWKLREFLEALGIVKGNKEAGTLDTAKLVGKTFGVKTFVRGADDARGFDEQARIRRMFEADGASVTESLDDEDLDGDDEASEYTDMSPADLRAELRERGLSTKGKTPVLIARLLEDDEESDDDEDEEDGDELDWDALEAMSRSELRALNTEEELGVRFTKSKSDEELLAEVAGALDIDIPEDEDEDEEDEEEDEDADDYDEWEDDDLKEELEQRSLSTKGSTKLLIKRLRQDDAEEEKPF